MAINDMPRWDQWPEILRASEPLVRDFLFTLTTLSAFRFLYLILTKPDMDGNALIDRVKALRIKAPGFEADLSADILEREGPSALRLLATPKTVHRPKRSPDPS